MQGAAGRWLLGSATSRPCFILAANGEHEFKDIRWRWVAVKAHPAHLAGLAKCVCGCGGECIGPCLDPDSEQIRIRLLRSRGEGGVESQKMRFD